MEEVPTSRVANSLERIAAALESIASRSAAASAAAGRRREPSPQPKRLGGGRSCPLAGPCACCCWIVVAVLSMLVALVFLARSAAAPDEFQLR